MTRTTKLLGVAAASGAMLLAAGTASARDNFSINLDLGGPAYYSPGPPAYVVRPAPAYYQPAPTRVVYVEPGYYRPYYYGNSVRYVHRDHWRRGWGHHPGWH